jgi:hypothetical protein
MDNTKTFETLLGEPAYADFCGDLPPGYSPLDGETGQQNERGGRRLPRAIASPTAPVASQFPYNPSRRVKLRRVS